MSVGSFRRSRLNAGPGRSAVMRFGHGIVRNIQRGTIAVAGASSTGTATITAVDTLHSRLRVLGITSNTNNSPASTGNAYVQVTNSTTLTATRNANDASVLTVSWEVVEYFPGVVRSIQRGTVATGSASTITSVNTGRSELDLIGWLSSNTAANNNQTSISPYVVLTNATTVTAFNNAAPQATVSWQVVEWV